MRLPRPLLLLTLLLGPLCLGAPVKAASKGASAPAQGRLEGEVDFQDNEDDEAHALPEVKYGKPRYGGHRVASAECDGGKDPKVTALVRDAWVSSRMVDDPKVLETAVASAKKALTLQPRSGRALLLLGSALAKLHRNAEALKSYETYVLSCPASVDAHRVMMLLERYDPTNKSR